MGKDILAVLIGVFGAIVGFYFGSEILANAPGAGRKWPGRLSNITGN